MDLNKKIVQNCDTSNNNQRVSNLSKMHNLDFINEIHFLTYIELQLFKVLKGCQL